MKKRNNRGNVLLIVLVIFLIITNSLIFSCLTLKQHANLSHSTELSMKQKNLEILLMKYYINEITSDILLSDSYETNEDEIQYWVDDCGSYYLIKTEIILDHDKVHYSFDTEIEKETGKVRRFEYI